MNSAIANNPPAKYISQLTHRGYSEILLIANIRLLSLMGLAYIRFSNFLDNLNRQI